MPLSTILYPEIGILDTLLENLFDGLSMGNNAFIKQTLAAIDIAAYALLMKTYDTIRYCEHYGGFEPTIEYLKEKKDRIKRLREKIDEVAEDMA